MFSHVADEGLMNACAGHLLRYRKQLEIEEKVAIFTDIKVLCWMLYFMLIVYSGNEILLLKYFWVWMKVQFGKVPNFRLNARYFIFLFRGFVIFELKKHCPLSCRLKNSLWPNFILNWIWSLWNLKQLSPFLTG